MHYEFLKSLYHPDFLVWDAIVAWRDMIYRADFYNNTKGNYLTNMLKMIESEIVNVRIMLSAVNESWLIEANQKIDNKNEWSKTTKTTRKTCLNSFYKFVHTSFDKTTEPYRRHPEPNEIKNLLSSIKEKSLITDISPSILCNEISKINERDAYIVWLMMHTGRTLEEILDIRKTKEDYDPPYIRFNGEGKYTPPHITEWINEICKNSNIYLFETAGGKRVSRIQVMRNLKKAGRRIGLNFDLTPKVLHGYVNEYKRCDKRSDFEKALLL